MPDAEEIAHQRLDTRMLLAVPVSTRTTIVLEDRRGMPYAMESLAGGRAYFTGGTGWSRK